MLQDGIYEEVLTKDMKKLLVELEEDSYEIEMDALDMEESRVKLASYISYITRKALTYIREDVKTNDKDVLLQQIQLCNQVINKLNEALPEEDFQGLHIEEEGQVLSSIYSTLNNARSFKKGEALRPVSSISESSLFTGSSVEPNMLHELKKEIMTSNEIDLLVSFIKWSGIRGIMEELRYFTEKQSGKLRVITTSYMKATDYKAIVELSKLPNTEVKVSYDDQRTRLHAKAYIFKRDTNFSTAYIGSSNLSNPALTSGLEWNMKITEKDQIDVMKKVDTTFETYWNNEEFKLFNYESDEDHEHLQDSLSVTKPSDEPIHFNFEIKPYYFQKEILENLSVEREVYGRYKNLIVAATGVGKTIVSAFDYKRFVKERGSPLRLLFVAHREEILKQSLDAFRVVMQDLNFGNLLVGSHQPDDLDHLFISIQSFNSRRMHEQTTKDYYDFIIVDEFHHAAANSYQKLLEYYEPKVLLGLTATPERMDGKSILPYFDNRIAAEIRLTEALDQKLLSPFQYFCVTDSVDLSQVTWRGNGYDLRELENVYTSDRFRATQVLKSVYKYVADIDEVKGLGFCAGVEHAKFMANVFNNENVFSIALHGDSDDATRASAKAQLQSGKIKFIFVADLYNEGVDIPEVNTTLFLRPTESMTVYLQQLGRGLRLADGKECLTVLDFIGQAHENYSFEERFRALIGKTKYSVKHYVENGFADLPRGSFIQLESQAKEYILRNIPSNINSEIGIIRRLKDYAATGENPLVLENFLNHYDMSVYDLYGRQGNRTFRRLLVKAGLATDFYDEHETVFTKRLPSLFHLNSKKLLEFYLTYIEDRLIHNKEERLMLNMLYYSFYLNDPFKEGFNSIEEGIANILDVPEWKQEIHELLTYNYNNLHQLEFNHDLKFTSPLGVHSEYTTAQIMAAFEYYNAEAAPRFQGGVKHFQEKDIDVFFVTLNKSDKDFSPSTLYEDYAINEELFHWQTQSRVRPTSDVAKRYINHRKNNHQIALFVREYRRANGYTSPFLFLGTADYVKSSGDRPMDFVWKLREPLPPWLVARANKSVL